MSSENPIKLSSSELLYYDVACSLHNFVEQANKALNLPDSRLYAFPEIDMHNHPARSGLIHPDGRYGFAFSYTKSTRGSAFLGFDFGKGRGGELEADYPLVPWSDIGPKDPIILQLQTSGDIEALGYFNSIRWEKILTNYAVWWSIQNGFRKAFLVPASMNPYQEVSASDWGKIRYNGTAKKCGFKKINGIYVKSLV
mgnify:CR=1 FL=1